MYRLVIFDVDDTLFDYKKGEEYALRSTLNYFGIDYQDDMILFYRKQNINAWDSYLNRLCSLENVQEIRINSFLSHYNINADSKKFIKQYSIFDSQRAFLFYDVNDCINSISKEIIIALSTNASGDKRRKKLKCSPISKRVNRLFSAEEIGYSKPSKEHILYIMSFYNMNPSQTLMVGDTLQTDILGGKNAGVDTCWICRREVASDEAIVPTYTIQSLSHLNKYLNKQ